MTRKEAAQIAVDECFWGDYKLSAESILEQLDTGDEAFALQLFSKIVDNASYPSRLIRTLFAAPQIEHLLTTTAHQPRWAKERYRLLRANLTGDFALVPERQWPRK